TPRTWRASSTTTCCIPAQVASSGTSRVRACSIARSAPSGSRQGLPGAISRPSKATSSSGGSPTSSVATHAGSTPRPRSTAACPRASSVATWVSWAGSWSPTMPMWIMHRACATGAAAPTGHRSPGRPPTTVRRVGLRGQHDDPCTPRRGAPGRPARRGPAVAALVALVAGLVACGGGDGEGGEDAAGDTPAVEWVRVGYDLANTRAVEDEAVIGPGNVGELAPAWEVTGLAGVSGTPAVVDGTVYLGDWTGHVRALDAATGEELWAQPVGPGYVGGSVAVDGDRVLAG